MPQTFNGLRGDTGRDWFRRSDLIAASASAGYAMTGREIARAIAFLPRPESRYGHHHYGQDHYEAVVAWATAKAQTIRESEYA